MDGYIINYVANSSLDRVKLNHELFGRITYRTYMGKKYAYYMPGILQDIKFFRLAGGKIFCEEEVDVSGLSKYGEASSIQARRDENKMLLMTGDEYWERVAYEKQLVFKKAKMRK